MVVDSGVRVVWSGEPSVVVDSGTRVNWSGGPSVVVDSGVRVVCSGEPSVVVDSGTTSRSVRITAGATRVKRLKKAVMAVERIFLVYWFWLEVSTLLFFAVFRYLLDPDL